MSSVYGTAAQHVARRARGRHGTDSDYGSDSETKRDNETKSPSPRQRSQSQSPYRPRSQSPSDKMRSKHEAANKVYSHALLEQNAQTSELSIWQRKNSPSPESRRSTASVVKSDSRPSSGRSSLVQAANRPHSVMDRSPRSIIMSKAVSRSGSTNPTVPRKPGKYDDDYLSYLGVHLERADNHFYCPGETIFGKIVLKLKRQVYIVGLDFRLKGQLDVVLFNGQVSHRDSETFLYHCHRMIGVWDQRATQLEPGSYVSHFKYILPNRLPNSVTKFTSCQIRVAYGIQAILTDVNKQTKQVSKMFLVHSPPLNVKPNPVYHTDNMDGSKITLKVESSNLIIGQPCVIYIDTKLRISQINVHLEQTMMTGPHKICEILNKFKSKKQKPTHEEGQTHIIRIMIPDSAMADIKRFTKAVDVEQNLHIKIKHKDTWLRYAVPVKIHPGTSQFSDDMPRFDKVKRYPTLDTKSPNGFSPVQVSVDMETENWIDKLSKLFKVD